MKFNRIMAVFAIVVILVGAGCAAYASPPGPASTKIARLAGQINAMRLLVDWQRDNVPPFVQYDWCVATLSACETLLAAGKYDPALALYEQVLDLMAP